MLDDGTYDVIIVDADDGPSEGIVTLEIAVASGPHRGQVITINARGLGRDPIDLLAVPATLTVSGGKPVVQIED